MARPPKAVIDHLARLAAVQATVVVAGRRVWNKVDPDNIDTSWNKHRAQLTPVMVAAQRRVASDGASYIADALAQQDTYVAPRAIVDPDALAGWAPDGRSLDGLLASPSFRAQALINKGYDTHSAMAMAGNQLGLILMSSLADTSRQAAAMDIALRPDVGWTRMADPGCCDRCAILAGQFYRWNSGFLRHPGCQCTHVPTTAKNLAAARKEGLIDDPDEIFNRLSLAEQDSKYTFARAEAIRAGADMPQVVNARRGMSLNGLTTTEGMGRRGLARKRLAQKPLGSNARVRLTPEAIILQAKTPEQVISELYRNGYIRRLDQAIAADTPWQKLLRTGTPAEKAAAEKKLRTQIVASAKRTQTTRTNRYYPAKAERGVPSLATGGTGGKPPMPPHTAFDAASAFPPDSSGRNLPFARSDVIISYSTFRHVWEGDVNAGRMQSGFHDPFGPFVEDKTLFPKRWFGGDAARDYDAAEEIIRRALTDGLAGTPVPLAHGRWSIDILYDDVVTEFILVQDGTVAALWPVNGRGVFVVKSVNPLRLSGPLPLRFPRR